MEFWRARPDWSLLDFRDFRDKLTKEFIESVLQKAVSKTDHKKFWLD